MPSPLFRFDQEWREKGHSTLAGADEAGRGPWAGPVVAAVAILPPSCDWPDLRDSKQLSPARRETLFDRIQTESLAFTVALVDAPLIDELNILQATFRALRDALRRLTLAPDLLLFDGNQRIPDCPFPQQTLVKGDGLSASIAAASVLAKVTRDRLMRQAHEQYPVYGFDRHKGYGTAEHMDALERHGPCPLHRRSFAPIAKILAERRKKSNLSVPSVDQ